MNAKMPPTEARGIFWGGSAFVAERALIVRPEPGSIDGVDELQILQPHCDLVHVGAEGPCVEGHGDRARHATGQPRVGVTQSVSGDGGERVGDRGHGDLQGRVGGLVGGGGGGHEPMMRSFVKNVKGLFDA
jgi:hypothetical protein